MAKIYTKTGDSGMTGLYGGARLPKDDIRIDAYGTVDELNSIIGWVDSLLQDDHQQEILQHIQSRLFTVGASLASQPGKDMLTPDLLDEDVRLIEDTIDKLQNELEPLKHFILPGGATDVSAAHIARTVCRRAERRCVALSHVSEVDPVILLYLNRLSDYFFVLARWMAKNGGIEEKKWEGRG